MRAREEFIEKMAGLDPTKLVFLDESGFRTSMNRAYGWAPEGEKPVIIAPKYGKNITIIGAIALDGVRASREVVGSFNGEKFLEFLNNDLGPTLREGDIVVMDGPRLHRVDGVAQAIAARGATVLYLPACSPELNPIEMCWSVMKAWIRAWTPRTPARLMESVQKAWQNVTSALCAAWFRHSGYPCPST